MYIDKTTNEVWESVGTWVVSKIYVDISRARCKANPNQWKYNGNSYKRLSGKYDK